MSAIGFQASMSVKIANEQLLDNCLWEEGRAKLAAQECVSCLQSRSRGESEQSVLAQLPADVFGLHVGDGISYVSFEDANTAERIKAHLEASTRWVVKYAELEGEGGIPPQLRSVESTDHVEVPGLHLVPHFLSASEASALLAQVDLRPWEAKIKRRVQHYGRAFDYAKLMISSAGVPEMPDFCGPLLARLAATGLLPEIDQLTVNEYQPGVGIAFHVDAHSAFEDGIAAVTLGSGIVMEFRKPLAGKLSMGKHHRLAPPPDAPEHEATKNVWLAPNSLLVMTGEARYAWQHGIAWRKTDLLSDGASAVHRGRRVSLTFRRARSRSESACECAWPAMCDSQNPEAHGLPSRLAE
ncbi:unnamed protein product [Effrenium voratum]|nr:unnamed protein product [Effrenium voratum]